MSLPGRTFAADHDAFGSHGHGNTAGLRGRRRDVPSMARARSRSRTTASSPTPRPGDIVERGRPRLLDDGPPARLRALAGQLRRRHAGGRQHLLRAGRGRLRHAHRQLPVDARPQQLLRQPHDGQRALRPTAHGAGLYIDTGQPPAGLHRRPRFANSFTGNLIDATGNGGRRRRRRVDPGRHRDEHGRRLHGQPRRGRPAGRFPGAAASGSRAVRSRTAAAEPLMSRRASTPRTTSSPATA